MLKAKSTGSGDYYSAGPFAAQAERLWGTTAVPALGVPAGQVLVGDTRIGATVLIREGVHVLLSDSDGDDFIKNVVALLGEMRARACGLGARRVGGRGSHRMSPDRGEGPSPPLPRACVLSTSPRKKR